jgi:hypothetical protein
MHINKRFLEKNNRLSRRHAVGSGPCRMTPLGGPNGWLTARVWADGPARTDGMPSGQLWLRRRLSWLDGSFGGRPWREAMPTVPIFGRRRSSWPSAQRVFHVVLSLSWGTWCGWWCGSMIWCVRLDHLLGRRNTRQRPWRASPDPHARSISLPHSHKSGTSWGLRVWEHVTHWRSCWATV